MIALAAAALVGGCAKEQTRYGDARGVETLTNQFGSTDLQLMAESMARSMLQAPVIASSNLPIVTVQEVRNKTSEYIDTRAITDSIRSELQKGGRVRFAVDAGRHESAGRRAQARSRAGCTRRRARPRWARWSARSTGSRATSSPS